MTIKDTNHTHHSNHITGGGDANKNPRKKVAVVACGISPFTLYDEKIETVLLRPVKNLFDCYSNIPKEDVDAVLVSSTAGAASSRMDSDTQHTKNDYTSYTHKGAAGYLSPILAELAGIKPRIAHTVESLCSSGTNAIVSGYSYIASGLADVVLVCGGDRHDTPGRVLDWDVSRGQFQHPVYWASMLTSAYKRVSGATDEKLAIVPIKNHKYAKANPAAYPDDNMYTIHDVMKSKRLTKDLRVLDCSRSCTGGAAIILASSKVVNEYTDSPVWITGIGQKTVSAGFAKGALEKKDRNLNMISTRHAGSTALDMAGRHVDDVDVAEIHDAFSVCEPMILESLGMSSFGKGIDTVMQMYETGDRKINPRGGLLGSGHPLGATGVAQTVEVTEQLCGRAIGRQIDNAEIGLVHNMAAGATSSTVLVLENNARV